MKKKQKKDLIRWGGGNCRFFNLIIYFVRAMILGSER